MGVNNSKATPTQVRLLQDIRVGTKVSFDARLHSTAPLKSDTDVVLHLRDEGQFLVASVKQAQVNSDTFEVASTCTRESLLRVTGTLVAVPNYEYVSKDECSEISVMVSEIVVVAKAIPDLTVVDLHGPGHKHQGSEQLLSTLTLNERLNNRVLDVRVAATASIFKLLSGVFELAVEHQMSHGFHWISTPHIINYNITGDNDYFPVAYYDRKDAWLAQTGEFHQQMAIAADLKRVFEIRSLFRAETSVSTRRLAEFSGLEAVMTIQDDWEEVTDSAESAFVYILRGLQEREKYKNLVATAKKLYSSAGTFKLGLESGDKVVRVKFREAKTILRSAGYQTLDEEDFSQQEEATLGRLIRDGVAGKPPTDIFTISHYPRNLRTFYMQPAKSDPLLSRTFDVILRGQENCSGGQTINSADQLREVMMNRNPPLDPDSSGWQSYVGSFDAGSPPQGSYGIGLNRLLQGFLGLKDIHETSLFPRDVSRLAP